MKLAALLVFAFATEAFAASGSILYSTGPYKGQDAIKNSSHFGYDEVCFTGNPFAARSALYKYMSDNIEMDAVFVRYISKDDSIVYGYINTKCTDEMANDPEDCRSVQIAKRCK